MDPVYKNLNDRLSKANQLGERLSNVFGDIASKANDCHNPSGSAGGQFCSANTAAFTPAMTASKIQEDIKSMDEAKRAYIKFRDDRPFGFDFKAAQAEYASRQAGNLPNLDVILHDYDKEKKLGVILDEKVQALRTFAESQGMRINSQQSTYSMKVHEHPKIGRLTTWDNGSGSFLGAKVLAADNKKSRIRDRVYREIDR